MRTDRLIEWTGEFELYSATIGVGPAGGVFRLVSECVDGNRLRLKVIVTGWQVDLGFPGSALRGTVKLEDGLSARNPDNLRAVNRPGNTGDSFDRVTPPWLTRPVGDNTPFQIQPVAHHRSAGTGAGC